MGNCIRKESSTQWGGEDWGSLGSGDKAGNDRSSYCENSIDDHLGEEKSNVVGGRVRSEMRIRISRKQLEQLLKRDDVQGMPVEQVLALLIDAGDRFAAPQRQWSPALQTIPE